ncbi:MAG TPA: hypothetical protein PK018_18250 [Candidatus Competibacter sp.]|nr:hypothetical protein [Candidatus Competibacter sp.]HRW67779.1 hypothetical protein [Candidatus Competibacter sp.]
MMHRAAAHAQRTRRLLGQEAMKRAHRRSELIRYAAEDAVASAQPMPDSEQQTDDRKTTKPLI